MQKAVVIKQTWAIILMTSHYLLEASGAPVLTLQLCIAARRLGYCTQEVVLSQKEAKCSLHNSVKLSQCSPGIRLYFVVGVDLTVTERFL